MLESAGVPVVETWDIPAKPIEHVVGFSNAAATNALVHHLHALGYRHIGFVGGTSNRDTRGADRRLGYVQAIEQLGLPPRAGDLLRQAADLDGAGRRGDRASYVAVA